MATPAMTWTFPLRRKGLPLFLAGSVLVALGTALGSVSFPIVPVMVATVIGLYACALAYLVVRDTAKGEDAIVIWPGFPVQEAFYAPVARVVVGTLWSCLPALLYALFVDGPSWIGWALFLLGTYFLPMVLVRVATRESFLAGQPMAVLICILRTLKSYTTVCVPYYLAVFATAFAATFLTANGHEMWLEAGLAYGVSLYLLLVQFYMLGLFHRRNTAKLHLTAFPTAQDEPAPSENAEPAAPEAAPATPEPPAAPPAETPTPDPDAPPRSTEI